MVGRMRPRPGSTPSKSGEEYEGSRSCLSFRFSKKSHAVPARTSPATTRDSSESGGGGIIDNNSKESSPDYAGWQRSLQQSSSWGSQPGSAWTSTRKEKVHDPVRLLTPPEPTDRSVRKRLAYEKEMRRRGLYHGEVEPEGTRGQEAIASPNLVSKNLPAMRSFERKEGNSPPFQIVGGSRKNIAMERTGRSDQAIYPSSKERAYSDDSETSEEPSQQPLTAIDETGPMQFSVKSGRAVRWSPTTDLREKAKQQGIRETTKYSNRGNNGEHHRSQLEPNSSSSDGGSTSSEEDIRNMMPDLVPTQARNSTDRESAIVRQPSSVAQRAAAAAAAAASSSATTHTVLDSSHSPLYNNRPLDDLNRQGMEHVNNGEYDQALAAFEKVLSLYRVRYGLTHAAVASAYHNLGTVHAKRASLLIPESELHQKCQIQALQCFQAAARTARDSLGSTHPNVAVSLVRIGFLLLQSKQYQNAIVTFQEALRIRMAHYGRYHWLVANLHNNMGVCYMHLGNFVQGRQSLETALMIQRNVVAHTKGGNEDLFVHMLELADTLFNIGGLCLEWIRRQGPDARRAVDAEEAFAEALEIRTDILGEKDPSVVQVKDLLDMARAVPRPRSISPGSRRNVGERVDVQSPARGYETSSRNSRPEQLQRERQSSHLPREPRGRFGSLSLESDDPLRTTDSDQLRDDTIFRKQDFARRSKHMPPLAEVSISLEEEEQVETNRVKVSVAPHLVPPTSPPRKNSERHNASDEVVVSHSFDEEFIPDNSLETEQRSNALLKSYSYDPEESCIISDNGIDSDLGRIHFPLSWSKVGLHDTGVVSTDRKDIVVASPFRTKENAELSGRRSVSRSTSSEVWGSETVNFATGNAERDSVMEKARALLNEHDVNYKLQVSRSLDLEDIEDIPRDVPKSNVFNSDLVEDGIAPLGGHWPSMPLEKRRKLSLHDMLRDPMKHLPQIHNEAVEQLKRKSTIDALTLFEVVLECQKLRHGPLHADVAAALHNIGIVHSRGQNYTEALRFFEEAARVRKGSLGKDHPHVAVSLVKVGITLLLLHRFDDALWNFREALSVRKHALGALHPATARIYNNVGCVHVELNEFREARRAFEAALDTQRNALCHDPESGPLMFATATTLCNLGYLYRYRDLHMKAALVMKEALNLQERVLGRSHPTVLSTLDMLADSCANSGQASEALKHYEELLQRFRCSNESNAQTHRAEAVLLYKMSRVHRKCRNRGAQLDCLKFALRAIRAYPDDSTTGHTRNDTLERRIQYEIRACREQIEKDQLKRV